MENLEVEIRSVTFVEGSLVVTYENDAIESLPVDTNTYKMFYETWLKNNPPFISDKHKAHMNNLILATINNNERCISDLNTFFQPSNEEAVKIFLTYMRKRVDYIAGERAKWTVIK
jgi:hypothetical protein